MATAARKGRKAYFIGSIVSQAAALIRYVILARLLGPTELGLAAMIILTSAFFDIVSDAGSERFIVQDAEGDDPKMQGLVQAVLVLRGIGVAAVLLLTAPFLANLYNAPQITGGLMALGLAPLVLGLIHMDIYRAQREGDFRPESWAIMTGEVAGLIGTATAAMITRDHTAILYGLVLRSTFVVIISHLTARRPYRWAFERSQARKFSQFAAPLFANGLVMYFAAQSDRILVGAQAGAAALGHYSAVLLLIYYPISSLSKFLIGIHLPGISAARDEPEKFRQQTDILGGRIFLLSVAMAAGYTLLGPFFVPVFYGEAFRQSVVIFALLGVRETARFLRVWPTVIAIGTGKSPIIMFMNVARLLALPIAMLAGATIGGLQVTIAAFVFGEFLALAVALVLLSTQKVLPLAFTAGRAVVFTVLSGLVLAWSWAAEERQIIVLAGLALVTVAALVATVARERATIADTLGLARRMLRRAR